MHCILVRFAIEINHMLKLLMALSLTALLLAGCGQAGPLFLPGQATPDGSADPQADNNVYSEVPEQPAALPEPAVDSGEPE
ncbi:MAG: putative small lipoprotein YifL [Alcanivorax sp.]|jgi:predicted small lipoprotein YifL